MKNPKNPKKPKKLIPEEVIVLMSLGIGDLVFAESGFGGLLRNGVKVIHLFARSDGLKLYHAYPGVKTYQLAARGLLTELSKRHPLITIDRRTHPPYSHENRVMAFSKAIMTSVGLPPAHYSAPRLPVSEENVQWAVPYANKSRNSKEKLIIWQIAASRPYKTLPVEKSIRSIERLAQHGNRVLAIANNHNTLPRIPNVKWMRGVSIERFMGLCLLADRVVAHDSAPSWIAAAVGAPVMAVFGPTNPLNYAIRAPNVSVLRWKVTGRCYRCVAGCDDIRCLSELPNEVLYAAAHDGTLPVQEREQDLAREEHSTAAILLMADVGLSLRSAIQSKKPTAGIKKAEASPELLTTISSLLRQNYSRFELVVGVRSEAALNMLLPFALDDKRLKLIKMPITTTPEQGLNALAQYATFAGYLHTFVVVVGDVWEPDELSCGIHSRLRGDLD